MQSSRLSGSELIDCARANLTKGIEVTAQRCGYGTDIEAFEHELQRAGESIGVKISGFKDLTTGRTIDRLEDEPSVEVAPESLTEL